MADGKLPLHHQVWLDAHPWRTEEWLRERTKDGFDVHHVDGDPANNSASNLVLIEHGDHMAIHAGGIAFVGRLSTKGKKYKGKQARRARELKALRRYEDKKRDLEEQIRAMTGN